MKKNWMKYWIVMLSIVAMAVFTGCQSPESDDSSGSDSNSTTTSGGGDAVPSLQQEARQVLPLAGQTASSSIYIPGMYEYAACCGEGVSYSAIGSFTYDSTGDYTSSDFKSFFDQIMDASNDTTTSNLLGLIGHGEFFANDIYYEYPDGANNIDDQRAMEDSRTVRNVTACDYVGAVDITGKTVTIPYFDETVGELECFQDSSSDLPAGHDALYNVFVKNDQSTDIKFLHGKINDDSSGKQYLVFYGEYSEKTHDFKLKIAQFEDADGDKIYESGESRMLAKVSGNTDTHSFELQITSGTTEMVGAGKSEGTDARFLAGFRSTDSTSDSYFFCIDSSGSTKVPVDTTSDCDNYVSTVEQMEFLDPITGSFDVTPTYE